MAAPRVTTRVAAAGLHEHLFGEARVFGQIVGAVPFASLFYVGITGHMADEAASGVLDAIASCGTVADPRVWPMKTARMVASHGGSLSGVAAGVLALSSAAIGPWRTVPAAAALLRRIAAGVDDDDVLDERARECARRERFLPGFGVPFRAVDERVEPLRRCLRALGRDRLTYVRAWESLVAAARTERSLEPNFGSAVAAALLDLGVAQEQMGLLAASFVVHMLFANAHEGAQQQAEVLRRLPAEHVRYVGKPARESPRARAAKELGR